MPDNLKHLIREKATEELIALITADPGILDDADENGTSGYLLVAYGGMPEVFHKATELKGSFTLHEAIVGARIKEVKAALTGDATRANQHSPDGFTPLSLATFFGHDDVAKLLLEFGADPGIHATNPTRVNALHAAVARENVALCRLFIEHGVDVNAPQMQNVTALHSAAHRGNLELVRLLVESGADGTATMDNGDTALTIAERDGHAGVSLYLRSLQ